MFIMGFGFFCILFEDIVEIVYNVWFLLCDYQFCFCGILIIYEVIKFGYCFLDGVYCYENEKEVGIGVQCVIKDGIVCCEEFFIMLKFWNMYYSWEYVIEMGKRFNEVWGVGYLDLYLIYYFIVLKYIDLNIMEYLVCLLFQLYLF